jgi:hypothetical protein
MSFNLLLGFTTGGPGDHQHQRGLSPHGDGNTDINENHAHIIVNGKVMPAGIDDHTHDAIDYPLKNEGVF